MPMLDVDRLSVRYGTKQIVDALSFSVSEGQWLMIAGPNGAGKSTALAAITQGTPYTGRVLFEGQNVRSMKPALRARAIGVLAQNHFVGYGFTVEEVVRLGRFAYAGGVFGRSREDDAGHVEQALTLTGLQDKRRQSVLTLPGSSAAARSHCDMPCAERRNSGSSGAEISLLSFSISVSGSAAAQEM